MNVDVDSVKGQIIVTVGRELLNSDIANSLRTSPDAFTFLQSLPVPLATYIKGFKVRNESH